MRADVATLSGQDDLDEKVYAEQIRLLYHSSAVSALSTILVASIFAYVQHTVIDQTIVIFWLIAMISISLIRAVMSFIYFRDAEPGVEWGARFVTCSTIAAIGWGAGAILLYPAGNIAHEFVVVFIGLYIGAAALSTLSVYRLAFFLFIIPLILPIVIILLIQGQELHFFIAVMMAMGLPFYLRAANNVYQNTRENIYLRLQAFENEANLLHEKEKAEQANRAKSEFLSRMSHELRTPLNAVLGFGQLLQMDENKLDESQKENVREILDGGQHLLTLINDVLDLSKIESGKFDVSMQEVEIGAVVSDAVMLVTPQLNEMNISIEIQSSNKTIIVCADRLRLKQVMLNLLSNAIKYNHPGGHINVMLTEQPNRRLRVSVNDTGDGISKEDIGQLFSAFVRLEDNTHVEGTGIGLVITKNIVEMMNGKIGVESFPGEGSTFWFELEMC